MKKRNIDKNKVVDIIFTGLSALVLCVSLYGYCLDKGIELSGVVRVDENNRYTFNDLWEGKAQSKITNDFNSSFPGRKFFIKLRNQTLYSVFNKSSNENVILGKDKYLFEKYYIITELSIIRQEDEIIQENLSKLETLDKLISDAGKDLYLFITPSKAHYFKDKIPDIYFEMERSPKKDNYSYFMELISDTNLKYFDSRSYLDANKDHPFKAPFFYSTGIHWPRSWGQFCALGFADMISQTSKWDLGEHEVIEFERDDPQEPDADLYNSLNLLAKPKLQYYSTHVATKRESDQPVAFYRGGSFMGQSINALFDYKIFGDGYYFENDYLLSDMGSYPRIYHHYDSYEQYVECAHDLKRSDIIVLEINEAAVDRMSFGFIDYLLEHPDFLK